jgi:hypothetical protein
LVGHNYSVQAYEADLFVSYGSVFMANVIALNVNIILLIAVPLFFPPSSSELRVFKYTILVQTLFFSGKNSFISIACEVFVVKFVGVFILKRYHNAN